MKVGKTSALLIALAVVVGIWTGLINAQSNLRNRELRHLLWNACRPIEVVAEVPSHRATKEGITEGLLRWAAETRLHAERLYTPGSTRTILHVRGELFHPPFEDRVVFLAVSCMRPVYDPEAGIEVLKPIWSKTFRRSVIWRFHKTVREELPKLVGAFLVEYLRVNEKACLSRPSLP